MNFTKTGLGRTLAGAVGLLAATMGAALADEVLQVGEIHPVTGNAAFFGVPMSRGVHLAAEEINAAGGIDVGGTVYKLEIVTEDDQSNPTIGVGALRKLQTSGVRYIIGPLNSPVASAIFPIVNRTGEITQIIDGATSPGIVNGKNIFRTAATLPLTYEPQLFELIKDQGFKTVAMITDRTHNGWMGGQPLLVEKLAGIGVEVVAEEHMKFGDTDFSAQITKIKALEPDVLVLRAYPNESATMTKQAQALGFKGKIVWTNTPPPSTITKNIPASQMEGVLLAATYMTQDYVKAGKEGAQELHDAYVAKYGEEPGELTVMSYDSVYILKAAIEAAGSIGNEAVNEALRNLAVDGVRVVGDYLPQDGGKLFSPDGDPMISGLSQVWKGESWSFLD